MKFKICGVMFLCPLLAQATYYSQVGQDRYLNEQFFRNRRNGVFVDIGAYDGIQFSNSYFFEKELGWRGICFEPHPDSFARLKTHRSCECINACVAATDGTVKFIKVDGAPIMLSGMAATYEAPHFDRLRFECIRDGGSFTVLELPSRNLVSVLRERGIDFVDYLSLDTEGGELDILKTIDFDAIYVWLITVENNYNDPAIRTFMESKGFALIHMLEQDEVYINTR